MNNEEMRRAINMHVPKVPPLSAQPLSIQPPQVPRALQEAAISIARQRAEQEQDRIGHLASGFFERLMHEIKALEASIQEDEQLVVIYRNKGGKSIFVQQIGYRNPQLFLISGVDESAELKRTFLVHMEAVELELLIVKTENADNEEELKIPPKRPMGFDIGDEALS